MDSTDKTRSLSSCNCGCGCHDEGTEVQLASLTRNLEAVMESVDFESAKAVDAVVCLAKSTDMAETMPSIFLKWFLLAAETAFKVKISIQNDMWTIAGEGAYRVAVVCESQEMVYMVMPMDPELAQPCMPPSVQNKILRAQRDYAIRQWQSLEADHFKGVTRKIATLRTATELLGVTKVVAPFQEDSRLDRREFCMQGTRTGRIPSRAPGSVEPKDDPEGK